MYPWLYTMHQTGHLEISKTVLLICSWLKRQDYIGTFWQPWTPVYSGEKREENTLNYKDANLPLLMCPTINQVASAKHLAWAMGLASSVRSPRLGCSLTVSTQRTLALPLLLHHGPRVGCTHLCISLPSAKVTGTPSSSYRCGFSTELISSLRTFGRGMKLEELLQESHSQACWPARSFQPQPSCEL